MSRDLARESVERAVSAAMGKKATDLVLLDLDGVASFTRYFLICSGQSVRQVQAISDSVEEQLACQGVTPVHIEGYDNGEWVLLDYTNFVVHVFSPKARSYYDLERLWRRAARLSVSEERPPRPRAPLSPSG